MSKKDVIVVTYVEENEWAIGIYNVGLKTGELKLISGEEGPVKLPEIKKNGTMLIAIP